MTLKERIVADFLSAYKQRDMVKKNFLSVLKGSIETNEGKGVESNDENVLKLIKSLEKGLNETIAGYKRLGTETSEQENELNYLNAYLPTQLTESEIRVSLIAIIANASESMNAGVLMGAFNKENKGKHFDNKLVSSIVKELI
jgi:uncharacterized protein YqeY